MLKTLLSIATRVGRPGQLLRLGTSGGRLLYLEAAMDPVSVVVALERADVVRLVDAASAWLAETGPVPAPAPPAEVGGGEWSSSPCVCSDFAGQHADGGRCDVLGCPCLVYRPAPVVPIPAARTVQNRTVAHQRRRADQRERAKGYGAGLIDAGRLVAEASRDG